MIRRAGFWGVALGVMGSLSSGCGARSELPECLPGQIRTCESVCGTSLSRCIQGQWETCDTKLPDKSIPLPATVRDFRVDHPDFESDVFGLDLGIVEPVLGADGKPVYAGDPSTPTTTGELEFDQWFHDVVSVNEKTDISLLLSPADQDKLLYRYNSLEFFPIDDQLYGNEGLLHNFHFTLEMHVDFRYSGGERLTFRGDDDVFVFINQRLAINLGGVHGAESATVDLDASAADLGITPGNLYPLALFFAERHTDASEFELETTISELAACE